MKTLKTKCYSTYNYKNLKYFLYVILANTLTLVMASFIDIFVSPDGRLPKVIGISIIFLAGISWLSQFIGLQAAIINGFLPFIYADFLKLLLATLVMPTAWLAANRMLNNLN